MRREVKDQEEWQEWWGKLEEETLGVVRRFAPTVPNPCSPLLIARQRRASRA